MYASFQAAFSRSSLDLLVRPGNMVCDGASEGG